MALAEEQLRAAAGAGKAQPAGQRQVARPQDLGWEGAPLAGPARPE